VRAFQRTHCLPIHFYTGWQFFLFLLFPLRLGYDWRGQRCGRFPNANTNSNGDSNGYRYANCHRYSYSHRYGYGNCDRNAWTDWEI